MAIGHWGTYKRLETLIEAFPAVLKRVPTAKLIVAGANHHTKPGYWESIREPQKANPRIEFRGYVPEEAIPELFHTASVVVMPYDSATGSSGPAHQACEYGVPIVCADIPDFRGMARDEDMAIRFYRRGDASDLADKLATLLQSPDLQTQMAEQNFSAAVRMTLPSVVRHYLRWFELARHKRAHRYFNAPQSLPGWRSFPVGSALSRLSAGSSPDWSVNVGILRERLGISNRHRNVDDLDGDGKA